jgi:hypothetical protein
MHPSMYLQSAQLGANVAQPFGNVQGIAVFVYDIISQNTSER